MTMFKDRERGEESKYKHDLELGFKIRNRRNKLFGLWVAQTYLGLSADEAVSYAKDVVMADFELPGDPDMIGKVQADLAKAGKTATDHHLEQELTAREAAARQQGMAE